MWWPFYPVITVPAQPVPPAAPTGNPADDFLLNAYLTQFNDDRQSIGGDLQNIVARAQALLASTTPGTSEAAFITGIITSAQDIAAKSQDQAQAVLQIFGIARERADGGEKNFANSVRHLFTKVRHRL